MWRTPQAWGAMLPRVMSPNARPRNRLSTLNWSPGRCRPAALERQLATRLHRARLALPWNTLLAGLVWIIQIVSPLGGST